jgi:hypothetical protein
VPLNATLRFGSLALLESDIDPETVPLPVGVKASWADTLCPAGMVSGRETPCRENCALLLTSDDTITLAPVALMVMA